MKLPNNVTRTLSKIAMKTRKASPTILVVGGVGAMIFGTVLACKAARKMDNPVDIARKEIEGIHNMERNDPAFAKSDESKKAKLHVYTGLLKRMAILYGPAALAIGGGAACIFAGHHILNKRYIGLAAAYTAMSKEAMIQNAKYLSATSGVTNPETGEITKEPVKKFAPEVEYYYAEPNMDSLTPMGAYAFRYRKGDCCCNGTYSVDYGTAMCNIGMLNEELKSYGYVFLDKCYSLFGYTFNRTTKEGRLRTAMTKSVGWIHQQGKKIVMNGTHPHGSNDPKIITAYDPIVTPSGDTVWHKYIIIDPMSYDPEATYFGPIIDKIKE